MRQRILIFANKGNFEPAYLTATTALTSAAMGHDVKVFFSFDAMRKWATGKFGCPESGTDTHSSQTAHEMGLPSPAVMLQQARSMGAKVVACETMLRLCDINANPADLWDEFEGLPSVLQFVQGGQVFTFG